MIHCRELPRWRR